MEKIGNAIGQVKSEKAQGLDRISAEALNSDKKLTTEIFHIIFKRVWEEMRVPRNWKEGYLTKKQKKGKLSKKTTEDSHY